MAAVRNQNRVSREDFMTVNVQAANEGKGIKFIAEKLGLTPAYVAQKRTSLRKIGIALPELNRGGSANKIDVGAAQALLAKLTGKDETVVKTEGEALVKAAAERAAERAAAAPVEPEAK